MVLIPGKQIKKFLKSRGSASWDKVEICEDGSIKLRLSTIKIMESFIQLGFDPKRRTDISNARAFAPIPSVKPFKLHANIGFKFISLLSVDEKIIEEYGKKGLRVGYIFVDIPEITYKLGLMFDKSITFLDKTNLDIDPTGVTARRIIIEDYAEFARVYFVGVPVYDTATVSPGDKYSGDVIAERLDSIEKRLVDLEGGEKVYKSLELNTLDVTKEGAGIPDNVDIENAVIDSHGEYEDNEDAIVNMSSVVVEDNKDDVDKENQGEEEENDM